MKQNTCVFSNCEITFSTNTKIPSLCSPCMCECLCKPSDLHLVPHHQDSRKVVESKTSSFHTQLIDLQCGTQSCTTESEYSFYKARHIFII